MNEKKLVFALGIFAILHLPASAAETEYMAILVGGEKVGHSVHTRTVEAGKVTTSEQMSFTIDRMGTPVVMKLMEEYVETTVGEPLRFESIWQFGATTDKVSGVIGDDGTVALTICAMGREEKLTFPWPAGALMAEGRRLLLSEKGLMPGTEYKAKICRARLARVITEKISVGPKKPTRLLSGSMGLTEITTVETLPDGEQRTTRSYVDNSFRAHKICLSVGDLKLELYRCPKESALRAAAPLDMLAKMLIPSPERIYSIDQAPAMTYTLIPAKDANPVIPSLDGQKVTRLWDGKIAVEIRPVAGPTWATFPYRGNKITLRDATRPTQYLQSDRKEVIELARKAVGDTRSSVEAVQRIESFVAQYMQKWSMKVGYASATEVIESREGDCTEFAVLTAALCRAVGIPAQVVVGVAYTNNFAGRSGFAGHAWTQAYIGRDAQGVWVSVDAAYKHGGGGYDAGHIAFAVGSDPTDFSDVAALDQFTVDKIQIHRQ